MSENKFEIIKKELAVSSPEHGQMLARITKDLSPEQLERLKDKAAEGQLTLELEQLKKAHQFHASSADIDQFIEHVKQLEWATRGHTSSYKASGRFETATGSTTIETKKRCYVATAVYGTSLHPDVVFLQKFRDKHLEANSIGRLFVDFYYRVGPHLANSPLSRGLSARIVRGLLGCACRFGRKLID